MQLILGWECAATTELHSAKNIMLQTLTVVSWPILINLAD